MSPNSLNLCESFGTFPRGDGRRDGASSAVVFVCGPDEWPEEGLKWTVGFLVRWVMQRDEMVLSWFRVEGLKCECETGW